MADYTTWAAVKTYLAITGTGDDTLGALLVSRANDMIDMHCRRSFLAVTETRTYDVPPGVTLWLDKDLLSVTTLTNGDSVVIAAASYVLLPANVLPKQAIRLRDLATIVWSSSSSLGSEQVISVAGSWGYSTTPPDDIVHAAIRLTAWLYKQRDAPFGMTARPDIGVIDVPSDLPVDVKRILAPYVRPRITGLSYAS
jgi:hypothetical protein